ncbi:immunity 53 family protein [Corallococcus caeni]|uniref:Rhodanese-related sulfurtransferase n=1 Tax=Corallococcus caeni TaxID=3082388 RepID=A0ABQ6QJW4_9BACT|nr:hypothetical protein ASNO1_05680 [Corallococcus sp. NO1]
MDELRWLEQWYSAQCRGDWANDRGVTIQSLDNPGWMVTIDLEGTPLARRMTDALLLRAGEPPSAENGNVGGTDWIECAVKDGRFTGAGDPFKLHTILRCFREWADQTPP